MPDDSCVNCEAYAAGKKQAKFLGETTREGTKRENGKKEGGKPEGGKKG